MKHQNEQYNEESGVTILPQVTESGDFFSISEYDLDKVAEWPVGAVMTLVAMVATNDFSIRRASFATGEISAQRNEEMYNGRAMWHVSPHRASSDAPSAGSAWVDALRSILSAHRQ